MRDKLGNHQGIRMNTNFSRLRTGVLAIRTSASPKETSFLLHNIALPSFELKVPSARSRRRTSVTETAREH